MQSVQISQDFQILVIIFLCAGLHFFMVKNKSQRHGMKVGPMEILMTCSPHSFTNSQTQILSSASNCSSGKSVSPWTTQTILLPTYHNGRDYY